MIAIFGLIGGLIFAGLLCLLQAFVLHKINVWYIQEHILTILQWLGVVFMYNVLAARIPNTKDNDNLTLEQKIVMAITYPIAYLLLLFLAWICK